MISDKQEVKSTYGYKALIAWQKADLLAHKIYDVTEAFPKSEMFGLTSQLRRAALSVPANIIEGYARNSHNEFHRFLSISLGSLSEVGYFLEFSYKRKFIKQSDFEALVLLRDECGRLIWKLYESQR